jgi:hypothetical protein
MRGAAIAAWFCILATGVHAGPLDDRLTATDPCRDLPQISETESVTLESATISVLPETAEMSVIGRIACRSGEGALFQSDASVKIEAEVSLTLDGCTATRSDVRLSEFDGNVGSLVEAFAGALEQDLAEDVAKAAEEACQDLLEEG